MHKVYVSGALTGIQNSEETKTFYEAIALLCDGTKLFAYVPHLATDPINHPGVTPRSVFETDKHQVSQADLVISYIGLPSLGVGMELAYAEINAIPIILLYEEGTHVSRFPRGIPTIIAEIQFDNYGEALVQLKAVLDKWIEVQKK